MKFSSPLLLASLAATLIFSGCGKSDAPASSAATSAPSSTSVEVGKLVEVQANDSMRFTVTRIEAVAGSKLTIKLTNVGVVPKSAMGHNLVILKKGTDATAFSNAAAVAAATDFIPPAMADKVIAHTKILGPKESDSFTITVPEGPGEYTFLCSFTAHYLAGMKGVLVVTPAE